MKRSAERCIMQKSIDNPSKMEPRVMTFQASFGCKVDAEYQVQFYSMDRDFTF